jgi:hypothetical protein
VTLADVSSQDIKTAAYTVNLDKTRLEPDEMASSRSWLLANVTGLSSSELVYVYPAGNEDAQTEGYAAAAGYKGGRGALSMSLGNKQVYSAGVNLQNVTSLGLAGLHGLSQGAIQAEIAALIFKSRVWGVPYGIFCHPSITNPGAGELTATEVGYILDAVLASGGVLLTNTQLIDWIATTQNVSGGTYYVSSAPGSVNLRATGLAPVLAAGTNQGSPYGIDLAGAARPTTGAWDLGAYQFPWTKHGRGGSASGWTMYGAAR